MNPADPHPVLSQFSGSNMPNQILRRDLDGGGTVRWLYQPGEALAVVGFDQDKHPLIRASTADPSGSITVWEVPSANQARAIYTGPQPATGPVTVMADSQGIWLSGDQGLSLYTQSGGLQKVSTVRTTVAGPCR